MKAFILFTFLTFSLFSYCQNYFPILSEKRVIIEVDINGKQAFVLIDTGSTLNLINEKDINYFGIKKSFYIGDLANMYSDSPIYSLKNCKLKIGSSEYMQFGSVDLNNIILNIEEDTGIKVSGILGTPAIKELGMVIDLSRGIVTINKNSKTTVSTD